MKPNTRHPPQIPFLDFSRAEVGLVDRMWKKLPPDHPAVYAPQ